MKRRLLSSLVAMSLVMATGCSITLGTPPENEWQPDDRPAFRSAVPASDRLPGSHRRAGRIGDAQVIEADGSHPTVLAGSDPDVTLVRQPTWSRDGTRIAWVGLDADGTSATVMTAAPDGTQTTQTSVAAAPFYLSWDPTSARIVYLGGSATADIELGLVDVAASTTSPIDSGSPFYFSWAPQGKQLLVHVGTDRLDRLAIDGTFTPLGDRPGRFNVPVWTADGRTLFYVSEAGGRQRLVANDVATDRREVLARFDGGITFVVSPDGERVAYQVIRDGPALAVPLSVIDRESGTTRRVATEYSPAFFWSPDGTKLLSLRPEVEERLVFRWNVWEDGIVVLDRAVRSEPRAQPRLPPVLRAVRAEHDPLVAGRERVRLRRTTGGVGGVGHLDPAGDDRISPVRVADGVVASWSPG